LADPALTQCTLYFRFYLLRALKTAGLGDAYVEMLAPWKQMLSLGLSTFAEKSEPTRSDCHAWSATPTYELLATVCGIGPAEPGFKSVRIEPHLGALDWVEGNVPHPQGDIYVRFERETETVLNGRIVLPKKLTGYLVWHGARLKLKGGPQKISLTSNYRGKKASRVTMRK